MVLTDSQTHIIIPISIEPKYFIDKSIIKNSDLLNYRTK